MNFSYECGQLLDLVYRAFMGSYQPGKWNHPNWIPSYTEELCFVARLTRAPRGFASELVWVEIRPTSTGGFALIYIRGSTGDEWVVKGTYHFDMRKVIDASMDYEDVLYRSQQELIGLVDAIVQPRFSTEISSPIPDIYGMSHYTGIRYTPGWPPTMPEI